MDFARLYAGYTPKRYKDKVQWTASCPPEKTGPGSAPCNVFAATTGEGRILIELNNNDLLIMEGYDDAVVAKARDVLLYNMSLPAASKEKTSK